MVVVFVLGYLAIALEHPLKVDKAASALGAEAQAAVLAARTDSSSRATAINEAFRVASEVQFKTLPDGSTATTERNPAFDRMMNTLPPGCFSGGAGKAPKLDAKPAQTQLRGKSYKGR